MALHTIHQVAVLEVEVQGVGRYDGAVTQGFAQSPLEELRGQTLNLGMGAVLQVIRLGRGVNLIAKLIAVGSSNAVGHTILRHQTKRAEQQEEQIGQSFVDHNFINVLQGSADGLKRSGGREGYLTVVDGQIDHHKDLRFGHSECGLEAETFVTDPYKVHVGQYSCIQVILR